jgi:acetate kinase
MAELLGRDDLKLISCHLGGSSSICAIKDGKSVATSMGMSPQSGLPQNNRVGDFDVFALPAILKSTGLTLDQVLDTLANRSGLEGIGGSGRDLRDIEAASKEGNEKARLALNVFIASARHYLGAYLVDLGGADAIVFTGGIGENSTLIREGVCRDLSWFGIELDPRSNASGPAERVVSTVGSRVQVWTVPTNEEIVVARQTRDLLAGL